MRQAPTSAAQSSADLSENAEGFALHLAAANRSPNTIKAYMEAVDQLDRFLADRGMPRAVANVRREHVEAFFSDQLERLRPASAANRYRSLQQFWRAAIEARRVLTAGMLDLPDHPPLIAELLRLEQRPTPSGRPQIAAPGRERDDFATALMALVQALAPSVVTGDFSFVA